MTPRGAGSKEGQGLCPWTPPKASLWNPLFWRLPLIGFRMTAHGWLADIRCRAKRPDGDTRTAWGGFSEHCPGAARHYAPAVGDCGSVHHPQDARFKPEAQALLGLMRKARETFPKESDECRELYRGCRVLADNRGINVGAYLTPRQIQILWPFVTARIRALLAQRIDRTTHADANSIQDEQFELYLYRRFTTRMRKKGLVPSATRDGQR